LPSAVREVRPRSDADAVDPDPAERAAQPLDSISPPLTRHAGTGVERHPAEWEPDELIDSWTLKFYELAGRFPDGPEEAPGVTVDYVVSLVKIDAGLFAKYPWSGRTIKEHRKQIRDAFGTRSAAKEDEERWTRWPAEETRPTETSRERLAEMLLRRCRSEQVEPPTPG